MPKEYKVYGCEFKCGTKHVKSLKKMLEHEEQCWYNHKNKTCMTCKHGELVREYDPHDEMDSCPAESYRYRVCNFSDEQHELYFKFTEELKKHIDDDYKKELTSIRPVVNCKKWGNDE